MPPDRVARKAGWIRWTLFVDVDVDGVDAVGVLRTLRSVCRDRSLFDSAITLSMAIAVALEWYRNNS